MALQSNSGTNEFGDIIRFVGLSFGLSWLALLPLVTAGSIVSAGAGWPTHLPALLGPAVAAILAAVWSRSPRAQLTDLSERLLRMPRDLTGWLIALSPLAIAAAVILALTLAGQSVNLNGLQLYSGIRDLPAWLIFLIVFIVNGIGEELGWRGYLLPRLQKQFGPLRGALLSAAIWAAWHAPMFLVLASYRAMDAPTILFGFCLGLLCGAFVLAHVTARNDGSVGAAALWHALYNMAAATAVGGLVPAAVTTLVMVWGSLILVGVSSRWIDPKVITAPPPPDPARP